MAPEMFGDNINNTMNRKNLSASAQILIYTHTIVAFQPGVNTRLSLFIFSHGTTSGITILMSIALHIEYNLTHSEIRQG